MCGINGALTQFASSASSSRVCVSVLMGRGQWAALRGWRQRLLKTTLRVHRFLKVPRTDGPHLESQPTVAFQTKRLKSLKRRRRPRREETAAAVRRWQHWLRWLRC